MRITEHPVLGPIGKRKRLKIFVNGTAIEAYEGETIASAISASGIKTFRVTRRKREPRGIYCYRGRCTDCIMQVDGRPNVRTCITEVKDGMVIYSLDMDSEDGM